MAQTTVSVHSRRVQDATQEAHRTLEFACSMSMLTTVPAAVLSIPLVRVDLSSNQIRVLPAAIGRLRTLRSLSLRWNLIDDDGVPDTLAQCSSLETLDMSFCRLRTLPDALCRVRSLTALNVSDNQIDKVSAALGQMRRLRSLNARYNQIGELPLSVADLDPDVLTALELAGNPLRLPPEGVALEGSTAVILYMRGHRAAREHPEAFREFQRVGRFLRAGETMIARDDDSDSADGAPRATGGGARAGAPAHVRSLPSIGAAPVPPANGSPLGRFRLPSAGRAAAPSAASATPPASTGGGGRSLARSLLGDHDGSAEQSRSGARARSSGPGVSRTPASTIGSRVGTAPGARGRAIEALDVAAVAAADSPAAAATTEPFTAASAPRTPRRSTGSAVAASQLVSSFVSTPPIEAAASLSSPSAAASSSASASATAMAPAGVPGAGGGGSTRAAQLARLEQLEKLFGSAARAAPAPSPGRTGAGRLSDADGAGSSSRHQEPSVSTAGRGDDVDEDEEEDDYSDAPKAFFCPITHEIMLDPVVAEDGHTYERSAISVWLTRQMRSPMTGQKLSSAHLTPNFTIRSMIREYMDNRARRS